MDRPICYVSRMPRIPDNLTDGVAFLYATKEDAAAHVPFGGTAFLVGRRAPRASKALGENKYIPFLVSNRHVVRDAGASVARVNRRSGTTKIIDLGPEDWVVHSGGSDLAAVCVFGLVDRSEDCLTFVDLDTVVTEAGIVDVDLGIGDEVFMLGRYVNHQGRKQNRPAARFGSIAMMPEPIRNPQTRRDELSFAVEMRSRSGFSGSPVVVYRLPGMSLSSSEQSLQPFSGVLGVNWGHILDENGESTWLNGVVPGWRVRELLEEPVLRSAFDEAERYAETFLREEASSGVAVEVTPPMC